MPEQHLKALSAAVRFNPLNRQTGVPGVLMQAFSSELGCYHLLP
nr:hypothetical protein PHLFJELL_00112 [Salmonella enterica subsp. enterica serovar Paratyphi B]